MKYVKYLNVQNMYYVCGFKILWNKCEQAIFEDRKIEALNVEHNEASNNLDQVHELYELKKEFCQVRQRLTHAKTNYWKKLYNNQLLNETHKSWLDKYSNQDKISIIVDNAQDAV